jgi:hypothetical protein
MYRYQQARCTGKMKDIGVFQFLENESTDTKAHSHASFSENKSVHFTCVDTLQWGCWVLWLLHFNVMGSCQIAFPAGCVFGIPTSSVHQVLKQHLVKVCVVLVPPRILVCHSLIINDVEHLFMYFFAPVYLLWLITFQIF